MSKRYVSLTCAETHHFPSHFSHKRPIAVMVIWAKRTSSMRPKATNRFQADACTWLDLLVACEHTSRVYIQRCILTRMMLRHCWANDVMVLVRVWVSKLSECASVDSVLYDYKAYVPKRLTHACRVLSLGSFLPTVSSFLSNTNASLLTLYVATDYA